MPDSDLASAPAPTGEKPVPFDPPADAVEDLAAAATRRGFLAGTVAAAALLVGRKAIASDGGGGAPIYRIHPAIGVARVGNADPSTYYIGPEIPGEPPLGSAPGTPVPPYKVLGKIKPQAVRYRVLSTRWSTAS